MKAGTEVKRRGRVRRGPGRPARAEQREDAREALLNAAHACMVDNQTIDISTVEIAQRAGLNPGLVNYYFGTKDMLLRELATRYQHVIADSLRHTLEADVPAVQKLKAHIRGYIQRNRQVPYLPRLHQKLLRESDEAEGREYARALLGPLVEFYEALIQQGVREGAFRPVDPKLLYFTILGSCDIVFSGVSMKYTFGKDVVDDEFAEQFIEHTCRVIMNGIASA